MAFNINTTKSIRGQVSTAITAVEHFIEDETKKDVVAPVEAGGEHVEKTIEKDLSAVLYKITITPLAVGHSIEVQLQHAAGEIRRTVISGPTTANTLVTAITNLTK